MTQEIIFSHSGCADGSLAVYAAQQVYPNAKVFYHQAGTLTMQKIRDQIQILRTEQKETITVIILDLVVQNFEVTGDEKSIEFIIIDHHEWSQPPANAFVPYIVPTFIPIEGHISINKNSLAINHKTSNVTFIHDTKYSAAVLAWKYFVPLTNTPRLYEYVQDRDLFAKKLQYTNEIMSVYYLRCHKMSTKQLLDDFNEEIWIAQGKILMEQRNQAIEYMVKKGVPYRFKKDVLPEQYKVLIMRGEANLKSDAGNEAVKLGYDIGIYFEVAIESNEVWLSMRSKDNVDVQEICSHITNKSGVGGGHKKASGATIDETTRVYSTLVNQKNWVEMLFERIDRPV